MKFLILTVLASILIIVCLLTAWCFKMEKELKDSWKKEQDSWEVKLP